RKSPGGARQSARRLAHARFRRRREPSGQTCGSRKRCQIRQRNRGAWRRALRARRAWWRCNRGRRGSWVPTDDTRCKALLRLPRRRARVRVVREGKGWAVKWRGGRGPEGWQTKDSWKGVFGSGAGIGFTVRFFGSVATKG